MSMFMLSFIVVTMRGLLICADACLVSYAMSLGIKLSGGAWDSMN
jgi:hypothetical protein